MRIKRIVDLSLPLNETTPVYPGDPIPKIDVATSIASEGYNLFNVSLGSQSGSHVDAPYHFLNSGKYIDEISLESFIGKGMLIDMTHKTENEAITALDLEKYSDQMKENPFVLIKTGWDRYTKEEKFFNHPFLTEDAGVLLIDNNIQLLGIDCINADKTGGQTFPVHDLFAAKEVIIGENWANFTEIKETRFIVSAIPLTIHCDGSPVRPIAMECSDERE